MVKTQQLWRSRYAEKLSTIGYETDPSQIAVVDEFARIDRELASLPKKIHQASGVFSRLFKKKTEQVTSVKGLYLFGTVGRGKTFLMDLFCEQINHKTQRLHFHHFMKGVHEKLRDIKNQQDPLILIAKSIADDYRILCLDEFMVTDITDAMLLYGLMQHLIDNGVTIVTTSNIIPDDLYKNGLQRERFLPTIALIKSDFVVHEIGGEQDFRRLKLDQHARFFSPLNQATQHELAHIFDELNVHHTIKRNGKINIKDRDIDFIARAQKTIWFDFSALCEGNRSQLDYIELAEQFSFFIVSNIPILNEFKEDAARRFLLLVDELYDRRITLILSSELPIEQIYMGKKILFEFDRLQSRLFEMQSKQYGG